MKITKRQLRRTIREVCNRIINEYGNSPPTPLHEPGEEPLDWSNRSGGYDDPAYDDEEGDVGIPLDGDRVGWYENQIGDAVWNIDELGMEEVSQDEVYDVLNNPEADPGLVDAINKSFADYDDYMYSS